MGTGADYILALYSIEEEMFLTNDYILALYSTEEEMFLTTDSRSRGKPHLLNVLHTYIFI